MCNIGERVVTRKTRNIWTINYASATSSTKNTTRNGIGLNPSLYGERSATRGEPGYLNNVQLMKVGARGSAVG